jgi:hypothetical protein
MTEEPQRRLLGCALFLALVLTTSVAQAQSPQQRLNKVRLPLASYEATREAEAE